MAALLSLLAIYPSSSSADEFTYRPCGKSVDQIASRSWTHLGNYAGYIHENCEQSTYQYLTVPTQQVEGPSIRWLPLGPGRVDAFEAVVTGRDLSDPGDQGMDFALAVCSGLDFPDDCGTPMRGATEFPYNPQFIQLSRDEPLEIPEGADRLVMFAACMLEDPGICPTSAERVEFSDMWVTLDDPSPPTFSSFDAPDSQQWFRAPPEFYSYVWDPESGISEYRVAANNTSSVSYICDGPNESYGCPLTFSGIAIAGVSLKQGRNTAGITALNRARMSSVERKVSFLYDTKVPSAPSGLSAVGANGNWIIGKKLRLHWENGPENLPTATTSGVAKAVVDIDPAGTGYNPFTSHFEFTAPGIDAAAIDLPFEDTWTVRVKTVDAAGNESPVQTLTIDSEDGLASPPLDGPTLLPKLNIAGTTGPITLTWSPGNFGRSGDCGFRGWLGRGEPPELALQPSTQVAPSGVTSWTIGAPGVTNLEDGMNTFAVANVSCSGKVSANFERDIEIDRVRPIVSATPLERWLPSGSALTLAAIDPGAPGSGSGVESVWYRIGTGAKVTTYSDSVTVPVAAGDHEIVFGAVDELGNPSDEKRVTVGVDEQAPSAAILPAETPGAFSASVSDTVSGVVDAWCEISPVGASAWKRLGDRFVSNEGRTSPISLGIRVPDDGSLAPGDYELRVVGRDAAGNVQTAVARTLRLPIRPASTISASVSSAKRPKVAHKSLTLNVGDNSTLRGQLLAADGSPIVGGAIRVVSERDDGGKRVLKELRTATGGTYSVALGTDVSRTLTIIFDGDATRGPARATARVNVRASVSMRLTSARVNRGSRLFAKGRVKLLSASVPARGIPVEIQYCADNGCTSVTISRYTDSDGGFSIEIPTSTSKRTTLSLRARVKDFPGWPFAEGRSPRRSVVVK